MKIIILGGDGYLGWPTALHLSNKGHKVLVVDNFIKKKIELEEGVEPLIPQLTISQRIKYWKLLKKKKIELSITDVCDFKSLDRILKRFKPNAIVHYAEQPSAPFSMKNRHNAILTQSNNVLGTLNLLFSMKANCPNAHLIKLGTMGEYGTPNIEIEEGYLDIKHKGRKDTFLFPKNPGSFYHLSKVHDSNNIFFVCKIWKIRATDLNQGIVYGIHTEETKLSENLSTSFHYDEIFGTVLNRFVVQAVNKIPLTIYGTGGQTRGYLNIKDTLNCVELAILNPAKKGELRIYNQFTEYFSVNEIAKKVQRVGNKFGLDVKIKKIKNPRIEKDKHYYKPKHTKLLKLGLKPTYLTDEVLIEIFKEVMKNKKNTNKNKIFPHIKWKAR